MTSQLYLYFNIFILIIKNKDNNNNILKGIKMEVKNFQTDVLIVGSGGAGSRAAIAVDDAGLKATIVSKGLSFRSGCTGMAEGGYNAVFKAVDKED